MTIAITAIGNLIKDAEENDRFDGKALQFVLFGSTGNKKGVAPDPIWISCIYNIGSYVTRRNKHLAMLKKGKRITVTGFVNGYFVSKKQQVTLYITIDTYRFEDSNRETPVVENTKEINIKDEDMLF